VSDGRHATGAFRSTSSIIWDPHPEYKIDAFGISMHLKLWQDDAFIRKDMKVTHFWSNATLRKPEDHDENQRLQGCFYSGKVEGEPDSTIRVSLCEGMHGHIQTSYGSFLIQPVENVSNSDVKILHRIQRLMTDKSSSGSDGRTLLDGSSIPAEDCAVQTDHEAGKNIFRYNV
uniref:Pep_M12B_propep domain-containing protein n=1 Tax=Anopheles dirus TaxID=7168 RepID=A0A182NLF5_9DIPT